jgi:DNA polymerase-1
MGLACYSDPQYEADDLIGTLADYWRGRGHPVCVVSSDKDLAQLVSAGDYWWDFSRNQKLGSAQLMQKFGVLPEQMADYLALTGDAVDNIPGVPGIGPKSAAALLSHFGSLDSLYERLHEVPFLSFRGAKSVHQKLLKHRADAELARQLTLICRTVASALAAPDISRGAVDTAQLNRLFDELQFGGMLRQRCLRA